MGKLLTILISNVLAITAVYVGTSPCRVLANTQDYGIEVTGQASVMVEPDRFALSIAIRESGRLTDKIRVVVDHKSDQVLNIAQSLGINAKDINSARVSLRVINDNSKINKQDLVIEHESIKKPQNKVYVGGNSITNDKVIDTINMRSQYFELNRNITVNFSDIKDYDQFLNKAIKIGVSQISPLTMSVADTDKYYQQALLQAITVANGKAQHIAKQAGQRLGKLVFVKELSDNHYSVRNYSPMMATNSAYGHNSQVGNQAISASVLVKYLIE